MKLLSVLIASCLVLMSPGIEAYRVFAAVKSELSGGRNVERESVSPIEDHATAPLTGDADPAAFGEAEVAVDDAKFLETAKFIENREDIRTEETDTEPQINGEFLVETKSDQNDPEHRPARLKSLKAAGQASRGILQAKNDSPDGIKSKGAEPLEGKSISRGEGDALLPRAIPVFTARNPLDGDSTLSRASPAAPGGKGAQPLPAAHDGGGGSVERLSSASADRESRILKGYIRTQLIAVTRIAMYYSAFSPLMVALGQSVGTAGLASSAYGAAIAVLKPVAGVLADRYSIRNIQLFGLAGRAVVWSLVPAAYLLWHASDPLLFGVALFSLMAADGAVVAINETIDYDEAGLDILAKQYKLKMDSETRNHYTSVGTTFYSILQMLGAPAIIGLTLFVSDSWVAASLLSIMSASFIIPAVVGVFYTLAFIPKQEKRRARASTLRGEVRVIAAELADGWRRIKNNPIAKWRTVFNGVETGGEDVMLIVASIAIAAAIFPGQGSLIAITSALLSSVGKVGAVLASRIMDRYFKPKAGQDLRTQYKIFFDLGLLAMLSAAALLPFAYLSAASGKTAVAAALAASAFFLHYLFFTSSELGSKNLLQALGSDLGASGRLFGIEGAIKWGISAAFVAAMGVVFEICGVSLTAFSILAAAFIAAGASVRFLAPRLMFQSRNKPL